MNVTKSALIAERDELRRQVESLKRVAGLCGGKKHHLGSEAYVAVPLHREQHAGIDERLGDRITDSDFTRFEDERRYETVLDSVIPGFAYLLGCVTTDAEGNEISGRVYYGLVRA